MNFMKSRRGQIEKLLMFVAMISVAAIAIYMIRSVVMRQDPCMRYEEPPTGINPYGGCLDDLSTIASQCETKYRECSKKKIAGDMLKCFTISKKGMLSECSDTIRSEDGGGFYASDLCANCVGINRSGYGPAPNVLMGTEGSGVLRFDYNISGGYVLITET